MKYLYAPWRDEYSRALKSKAITHDGSCVFCTQLAEHNDAAHWIIKRFKHTFVMLNKFPYNAGHTLVIPNNHGGSLSALDPAVRAELMEVSNLCVEAIQKILNPPAFNLGVNMGKESGGSITDHLHVHVLPRWAGDTNFLPTLSNSKIISNDLPLIYTQLKNLFDDISVE